MKFWGPPKNYLGAPRLGAPHKDMGAPFSFGGPRGPRKKTKIKKKRGGPQRKKPMGRGVIGAFYLINVCTKIDYL